MTVIESPQPKLRRTLGLADVTLFFIVAGSNFQWVAAAAAAGPSSLAVWVIGCAAMFLPLSIVVVYLSSHHPEEGGLYVWSKRAFGPFAGFITGWTYWASNLPYFPALLYFMAGNALFIGGEGSRHLLSSPAYFIIASVLGLGLAAIVNVFGLNVGKWLNNIGALSRWTATLILIGLGIFAWLRFGSATTIDAATIRPGLQVRDLVFWSVIAFAWTGPEAVPFMGGEIKNPRRSIPFGLAIAAPVIAMIYLLGTVSVLTALAPSTVNASSGVMQAIEHITSRLGWGFLAPFAAVLVAMSCLGSAGVWLGAVARIPFVVGIDRYLPNAFAYIHPRWGSPVIALLAQAGIAVLFILLGQGGTTVRGAYEVLVSTTVLITLVPFLFLFASAIKLYAEPSNPSIVRIPGGRWTVASAALIGLMTTLAAIILAVIPAQDEPNKSLALVKILGMTALMVGSGVIFFVVGNRRKLRAKV